MQEAAMDLTGVIAKQFDDIDLEAVEETLTDLGLHPEYSVAAVAAIDSYCRELTSVAARMKADELPRADRKAAGMRVNRALQAKAFLLKLRRSRPGDVGLTPLPAGGDR